MTNEELLEALHSAVAVFHDDLGLILGCLEVAENKKQPAPAAEPAAIDKFIEPTKSKPVTLEDVRAVLTKVSGKHGAGTVKQLLAPHKKLSDVPQTEWAALIAKAEMIND